MLPLWSDNEQLILGDRMLTLYRRGKSFSTPLPFVAPQHIDFDALNFALSKQLKSLSGRKVSIILSNAWVRYLLIPGQANLYSRADWTAVAQNYFRERYGSKVNNWDVQINMQGYGQPVLAAAIDHELIEGLDRLADSNRWQLQVVEPAFTSLVNSNYRKIRKNAWLLMAENNHLLFAESKNSVWQKIRVMMTTPETLEQHALMLLQQAKQFNTTKDNQSCLYLSGSFQLRDVGKDIEVKLLPSDWLEASQQGALS